MDTRFSCTGCGKCCTGHHVPLTLVEARQWSTDGGQVIILVEGFLDDTGLGLKGLELSAGQREHAQRRSIPVRCGDTQAYVSITFASYNPGRCRNLGDDNRCAIYERRPLVCRIYPMEINPHIPLRPEMKDCPPESWQEGAALIHGGRVVNPQLAALIEQSRQADRDEIGAKTAICALLGISTMALKGDGFTVYLPEMEAFMTALELVRQQEALDRLANQMDWSLRVSNEDLASQLEETGALIASALEESYAFIALGAA
ncbi:Fe-S-cluster containining protein [Pseudomonas duriflava]|uniref:Fe-S-cluster containining protein n=1 Tax=Pseudomonas duriflava TaxID=459528 RepID=A0A562QE52_9PSED|nr:YkgJ family cysteine cluster protein [Pseudomonas duriflava]TWI55011.1 Fe-S-cluster containining protein [Pseudomonas duriflava]